MRSAAEAEALAVLGERLAQALAARDWPAMGAIDQAIREALLRLAEVPPSAELAAAKVGLKRLHGQALVGCREECERLRLRLRSHLEYAEGRSAYLQTDLMQGER
jgi:hypothetical protein